MGFAELSAGFAAAAAAEMFFDTDKLPAGFKFDNADEVSGEQILEKLNREGSARKEKNRSASLKFDSNGNITKSTPERLAAIENYRKQAENMGEDGELTPFDMSETKLNRNMIAMYEGLLANEEDDE